MYETCMDSGLDQNAEIFSETSRLCKSQFTIYRQRTMHIFILEGRRSGDCA